MEKPDIRIIAAVVAAVLVMAVVVGLRFTKSDDKDDAPKTTAPVATLPSASAAPTPDAPEPEAVSDVAKAQTDVAANFIGAYFAYSYKDATYGEFAKRARPFMTDAFAAETAKALSADSQESVEWNDIVTQRRAVVAGDISAELDPMYDASNERAVVFVTFTQATSDAVGTGGVGDPQTRRVLVKNVGGKYLVDSFFETGDEGA